MSFLLCVLMAWHFFNSSDQYLRLITLFALACGVLFLPKNLSLHVFVGCFYLLSISLWATPRRPIFGLLTVVSGLMLGLLWSGFLSEAWFWAVVSLLVFGVLVMVMVHGHFAQLPLWLYAFLFAATFLIVPHWSNNLWIAAVTLALQLFLFLSAISISENQSQAVSHVTEIQAAERSRIYQNIHDDVGAELLRLIYLLDDETQQKQVKNIMQRLRRAVAQTTQISADVRQLCDEIIALCQQRLIEAGIEFRSDITIGFNYSFTNTHPSGLLRIINELLSNIIRHANAQKVLLQVYSDKQQLSLCLCDNGRGLAGQEKDMTIGRGLRGLRKRATVMNAEIIWQNLPDGGLSTTLRYPWQ